MSKAGSSLRECRALADSKLRCGAASRAYYAVYQLLRTKLEEQGWQPKEFLSKEAGQREKDAAMRGRWSHGSIVAAAPKVLKGQLTGLISFAYGQRIKADYKPDPVAPSDLERLLREAEEAFRSCGVTVKAPDST